MKTPFLGAAYTARSVNVAADRCVNLYLEANANSGKGALYRCPGLVLLQTLVGEVRGFLKAGVNLYAVAGNGVYRVSVDFSYTLLGTIGTSAGPVSMATNGTRILLVDGNKGYTILLSTGVVSEITDVDFPSAPTICGQLDIYFIVINGTGQFYYSQDGITWDALDFASAEGAPDNIISLLCDHREAWFFGENTIEVWANAGDADNTLQRIQGAYLEVGIAGAHARTRADNSIYWLAADESGGGIIYRAQGYLQQRVSDHGLEQALEGYTTLADCIAFSYQQQGHTFVVFTFPTADKTWAFDVATGRWDERAYMTPGTGELHRHRANCHIYFSGRHVVGDHTNGKLYAFDLDVLTDNGDAQKWIRAFRAKTPGDSSPFRSTHHALHLQGEMGVGLNSGQGSDPQVMLRYSDDGGHTWSNERWTSLGAIGNTGRRAIWRRLGTTKKLRDRVYEISGTDPVRIALTGAEILGAENLS